MSEWTDKDTFDTLRIMDAKLTRIEVDQKGIKKDLQHHIRRTEAAEERLDVLEEIWEKLQSHLHKVEGMLILAKWIGGAVSLIIAAAEIINIILKLKG